MIVQLFRGRILCRRAGGVHHVLNQGRSDIRRDTGLDICIHLTRLYFGALGDFVDLSQNALASCIYLLEIRNKIILTLFFCIFQQHLAGTDDGI